MLNITELFCFVMRINCDKNKVLEVLGAISFICQNCSVY